MRRLADRVARPAALWGRWFGGGALLFGDPVEVVRAERAEELFRRLDDQPALDPPPDSDGLIGGGWLVCLGYAAGASWAGFCDWVLRRHPGGRWTFETLGLAGREAAVDAALRLGRAVVADGPPAPAARGTTGVFRGPDGSARERHLAATERAVGMIHRGEVYQLNLCTRLRASTTRSPVDLFADVVGSLRPAYGGLLTLGDRRALVSCSPELFLTEHDGLVVTAPIKGTTASAGDPTGTLLAGSTKDAAENVMITDLMRNDLSRVCVPGTVMVSDLLGLQRHPGVWHLVSTVSGRLAAGTPRSELLAATFPPGSVTGAPKRTAVAGIAELETTSRGAYTGAFGLLTPTAGLELSVTIRSFEIDADEVDLGVGGGITVDSVGVREWDECLHKAAPLVAAAGGDPGPRPAPVGAHHAGPGGGGRADRDPARRRRPGAAPGRSPRAARPLVPGAVRRRGAGRPRAAGAGGGRRPDQRPYGGPGPGLARGRRAAELGRDLAAVAADAELQVGRRPVGRSGRGGTSGPTARRCRTAEQASAPALPYFTGPEGHVAETSRGNLFIRLAGRVGRPRRPTSTCCRA